MRVETATATTPPTRQDRQDAAGEQLQNLFTEILLESGKSGYASAEAFESENAVEEDIQQTWDDWYTLAAGTDHPDGVDPAQLKADYGQILVRAYEEGGYVDPQGFLNNLSEADLATVQHVARLVDPIKPDSLTPEGALNLLIPRPAQVDYDHNGITQVGKGNLMRFPDSNTPAEVVAAWEETTADMSFKDKMIHEFHMLVPILFANMEFDSDGNFVRQREPGDADWVNPMASGDYSYQKVADDYLEYLEYFKYQIPKDQYEEGIAFWTEFQENLQSHGAR